MASLNLCISDEVRVVTAEALCPREDKALQPH